MSEINTSLKRTPLFEKHLESGAKMVPFSGWEMPVQYTGIIAEHMHTREKAGLFDICHMGEFVLKGPGACADLDKLISRVVADMPQGKCRYGLLLDETGGVIDDLIVFRMEADEFMLVVNASTRKKDSAWIRKNISGDTEFTDISDEICKIDLQGPLSSEILAKLEPSFDENSLKRYSFTKMEICGIKTIVSRTGYTGELGYEFYYDSKQAAVLWGALLAFEDVMPVGLGARDTLRLEMGYSLYGHEIDDEHTPLEAGLEKFVSFDKDFIGKEALLVYGEKGVDRTLKGFICETRRSARSHFDVMKDGETIGEVTSGAFSPCLQKGIGLCSLDKEYAADGSKVVLTDGKIEINADITSVPIYNKKL